MRTLSLIGYLVFLMATFYGITNALGPEFVANLTEALFGGYVTYWNYHIGPNLPGWTNPTVLVILVAFAVTILPGVLKLSRFFASVIIAVFAVRIAFLMLGAAGAPAPSAALFMAALFAAGWLLVTAALVDRSLWNWIRDKTDQMS